MTRQLHCSLLHSAKINKHRTTSRLLCPLALSRRRPLMIDARSLLIASPSSNGMSMRNLIPAAAFAASLFLMHHATAGTLDISAGAAATVGVRWTQAAFLDVVGETREDAITWQPTATFGYIGSRSDRHDDLDRNVFIAGAGGRWVAWRHAFLGFEFGYASARTDALSSHEQFISSLGWQGGRAVVMLRHISNGDLFGGRNLGETMVLAGLSF
jgi:hypothetical protein